MLLVHTFTAAAAAAKNINSQGVTREGYLTDDVYCNKESCLVYGVNCISCDSYGISKDLAEKYTYASVYESRERLYDLKRCVPKDRPKPGTINISNSRGQNLPYIIAAATQYGIGEHLEKNEIAQDICKKSKDRAMVAGLRKDTSDNRLSYFKEAMSAVIDFIQKNPEISRVVLPRGIGRTCARRDEVWEISYLPVIEEMHRKLKPFSIDVILLSNEDNKKKTTAR